MLEEILNLQRAGDHSSAIQRCRELLLLEPDNSEAMRVLSVLTFARGDAVEALQLAEAAVAAAPENELGQAHLGGLLFSAGRRSDAEAHLREALRLNPNTGSAYLFLGQIALERGDSEGAREHFKSAERVDADNPQTMASLGNLALENNDSELALRYFTRAAALAPADAAIQAGLGRVFYSRGMFDFSAQALTNALRTKPDFHAARHALAQTYLKQERADAAHAEFQALLSEPAYHVMALTGLGDAARARADFVTATEHYRAALTRDPALPRVAIALGWCLLQLGQADAALRVYDDLLARQPDQPDVRAARAEFFGMVGRQGEALAAWQAIEHDQPDHPLALARLPLLLDLLGQPDAAAAMARRAQARQPGDIDARLVLARSALRAGDAEAALQQLAPIDTSGLPDGAQRLIARQRGFAFDQAQRHDEAIDAWLLAQRGLPSNGIPRIGPLAPEFLGHLAGVQPATTAVARPPVLLLGAPGSGVQEVANLLVARFDRVILRDRFQRGARQDLFGEGDFAHYLDLDASAADALARRYFALRNALDLPNDRPIDWIPRWDATFLLAVSRALPGTRIIVVERDPRATLMNWLACGWATGFALPDIDAAADWLAVAATHFAACGSAPGLSVLRIDADRLQTDLDAVTSELAAFLPEHAPRAAAVPAPVDAGMPEMLAPGHWQAYRHALATPFSRLDATASAT